MTDYLTLVEVLTIHHDQIERYGGAYGIRDRGLLEAALFRPQTGHYADVVAEAAALWESLAQNHPFIDGNRRIAFAVMLTFLAINGLRVTAEADAIHVFIMRLYAERAFNFAELERWLRRNASGDAR